MDGGIVTSLSVTELAQSIKACQIMIKFQSVVMF